MPDPSVPRPPVPSLRKHVEAWLALHRGQVQPSTWESYRYQLERYVFPALGDAPLDQLTPQLLTAATARCRAIRLDRERMEAPQCE